MTISSRRLALAASGLLVLGAIGGGLVGATASAAAPAAGSATTAASSGNAATLLDALVLTGDPASSATDSARFLVLGDRLLLRLGGLRQHFVHGTLTVLDRDGKPVTFQLDHGTISTVASGSITIAEAGGTNVSVATTAETRVRVIAKPATLAGLKVGDEVVVRSTVNGGAATATLVVVLPKTPATVGPAGGNG